MVSLSHGYPEALKDVRVRGVKAYGEWAGTVCFGVFFEGLEGDRFTKVHLRWSLLRLRIIES